MRTYLGPSVGPLGGRGRHRSRAAAPLQDGAVAPHLGPAPRPGTQARHPDVAPLCAPCTVRKPRASLLYRRDRRDSASRRRARKARGLGDQPRHRGTRTAARPVKSARKAPDAGLSRRPEKARPLSYLVGPVGPVGPLPGMTLGYWALARAEGVRKKRSLSLLRVRRVRRVRRDHVAVMVAGVCEPLAVRKKRSLSVIRRDNRDTGTTPTTARPRGRPGYST